MKIKKDSLTLIVLIFLSVLLIAFSPSAKIGAKSGLSISENVIIPSLLPLLIIFNLISKSKCKEIIENLLGPFFEKVFRLPKCATEAIIFGMIGGYPMGAILTDSLFDSGEIDKETAKRILRFNVNGGCAFIITAVGATILNSHKAGMILFASTTFSALLIAFLSSFKYEKIKIKNYSSFSLPFPDALNNSVDSAIKSVLNISAYIILFSALTEIVKIPKEISPFIEITNGIVSNGTSIPLPFIAFFLAFSGFCIHFQILSVIKKMEMKYLDFFLWRIIHGGLSFLFTKILLYFFPTTVDVFSNSANAKIELSTINSSLSVMMILTFVVLIFDIENKKRKC